jgi:magnesium-transporting ATPase (P-type)
MAVTKIRKISSWTLLITSIITIIVLGMFYFGGVVDPNAENKEYVYTGLLLDWTWLVFAVTIIVMAVLALWQFVTSLKTNPKSALRSFGVVVLFALLLIVTYSMGDGTPVQGINADSQAYNTEGWLKVTDMWILSSIVLFVLIVIAVALGTIKRIINK